MRDTSVIVIIIAAYRKKVIDIDPNLHLVISVGIGIHVF